MTARSQNSGVRIQKSDREAVFSDFSPLASVLGLR